VYYKDYYPCTFKDYTPIRYCIFLNKEKGKRRSAEEKRNLEASAYSSLWLRS